MQLYQYTAGDDWPVGGARTGLHIKQQNSGNIAGVRRSVGDIHALIGKPDNNWTVVQHDTNTAAAIGEAVNDANTWGILTPRQLQCMCIIVAIFDNEGDRTWSHAWLTHVSSEWANEVNGMIAKLDATNYHKAYVAIGGRKSSLVSMIAIKDAFNGTEVPAQAVRRVQIAAPGGARNQVAPPPARTPYPNPVFRPETVMIYAGGKDDEELGFGLSKDGYVGEVTWQL